MNKDKYVIANCPAYRDKACLNHSSISYCYMEFDQCQDCTDCVSKLIVEKCRNKVDTEFNSASIFAEELLQLFNIQEVNNNA